MSVKKKPLVVVTRKLPDSIETRMRELFDARLNLDDTPMTPEQIAEAVRTAEVLVPTVTDEITEDLLKQPDCKLVYLGTSDDRWNDATQVKHDYLREALDALVAGREPETTETRPRGCPIPYPQ